MEGLVDEKDVNQPRLAGVALVLHSFFLAQSALMSELLPHVALANHRKLGKRDRRFLTVLGQAGDEARGLISILYSFVHAGFRRLRGGKGAVPAAYRQ